jgi:hypothetical protein
MDAVDTQEVDTQEADALVGLLALSVPSAGLLDGVDFGLLSVAGCFDALVACERLARHVEGLFTRALGALQVEREGETGWLRGSVEAQVTAALRWPPGLAQQRLSEAGALCRTLPETLGLLERGEVSGLQARAMVDATTGMDEGAARWVQARVLGRMPLQSLANTRRCLHSAVTAADPAAAQRRHERQRERRHVECRPEADGMATLSLFAPAETARAMMSALDQHCRQRAEGDTRTLDQRRADTLVVLVLTGAFPADGTQQGAETPVQVPAMVQVTIGFDTLIGAGDQPAQLDGYGTVTAAQARALAFAPGSLWRRLLIAPDGTVKHADPKIYKPTAAMARQGRLTYPTCTFPSCGMSSDRCDLDHIIPFSQGGQTTPENLHPACRRHHQLKTHAGWRTTRDTDGTITWTAPTAHNYTTKPHAYPTTTADQPSR